jgi:hypothetical protein
MWQRTPGPRHVHTSHFVGFVSDLAPNAAVSHGNVVQKGRISYQRRVFLPTDPTHNSYFVCENQVSAMECVKIESTDR